MDDQAKQDRYSEDLLAAAQYLLTVDDPLSENRHFSGLSRWSAEPGELMGIIRHNAYVALENDQDRIPEDNLFIEVESRIQSNLRTRLNSAWIDARYAVGYSAAIVGISVGGMYNEGVLFVGLFFGGIIFSGGLFMGITGLRKRRSANENFRLLRDALRHNPAW